MEALATKPTPVVAAVIEQSGRYLLCRRPKQKRHDGLWEFPGGKLEANESLIRTSENQAGKQLGRPLIENGVSRLVRILLSLRG